MKIEKDRFYKLRNGEKAEIYATNRKGPYCIHGVTGSEDDLKCWKEDGCYAAQDAIHIFDIVSEWVEPEAPRPRMLAWRDTVCGPIFLLYEGCKISNDWVRAPWLDEPEGK